MALPRFFAMTSISNDKKYLSYINGDDNKGVKVTGFLNFSGKEVVSHLTKFETEMAEGGLVHIKSCYNNKYWQLVTENSQNGTWIVAGANEKEEDTSKWSCTLFKPIHVSTTSFQFRHVQRGDYLNLYTSQIAPYDFSIAAMNYSSYMSVNYAGGAAGCIFSIIDWPTLGVLPKHVAFKGENHAYVKAIVSKDQPYLQFSADKIRDPKVGNEIFYNDSGSSIRIKNNHFKKFWRRNQQDWITIDADESSINDKDTLFSPTIIENNVIVLRNEGNSKLCKLLTTEEETSCLSAADPTFSSLSRMEVEDLVRSSCIFDVDYHLIDEKIYSQSILTVASADVVNDTEETVDKDVKLSYTDVMTWSMSSNVSSKLGYKSKVTASIPKIVEANAKITDSFSGEYLWGKTEEMKSIVEVVHHATMPPMTKVEVKLTARKGSCDIPFSYTRDDVLKNGRHVTEDMDDGIYTCSNCFNFNYEISEEPI